MTGQTPGTTAPLVEPAEELTRDELARYARQLALPGIGEDGQRRLRAARVLAVGAGGLGSPALLYLAAAGVGTLGIVDDDVVETSNLQRQVVHGERDVGRPKTASAADAVRAVNPHTDVVEHRERLTRHNALDVLGRYDLVLDGSDAFATRYLVSDAAEILGLPCVWGALHRFTGQVSTFWAAPRARAEAAAPEGVTYRDVFPVPPPPGASPDCATAGVLGAVCGTVGTIMATEAVKLITGAGRPLLGRLAVHDALDGTWRTLTVRRDPDRAPVTELLDAREGGGADPYALFCGAGPAGRDVAAPGAAAHPEETSVTELVAARERDAATLVLDVREPWESRTDPFPGARLIPSGNFTGPGAGRSVSAVAGWADGGVVHVLCASGVRSARVAARLRESGIDARSVTGGMRAYAGPSRRSGGGGAPAQGTAGAELTGGNGGGASRFSGTSRPGSVNVGSPSV
ncbi:ThiF family adenylyltransferase [Myceligenerans salitolerans]|uniref:ThiF family adenylyltransferase n=1 Tax=Myceligenerans salitolerans TaxID=1230528 RepID=A0ABS3I5K9_9MICO|nr:ThiF family adenylyltransferase [Myceligenerans salitolerans]MBO0608301.1 ThiF family adenylyltransferase [Myceligenerans salitolerans]